MKRQLVLSIIQNFFTVILPVAVQFLMSKNIDDFGRFVLFLTSVIILLGIFRPNFLPVLLVEESRVKIIRKELIVGTLFAACSTVLVASLFGLLVYNRFLVFIFALVWKNPLLQGAVKLEQKEHVFVLFQSLTLIIMAVKFHFGIESSFDSWVSVYLLVETSAWLMLSLYFLVVKFNFKEQNQSVLNKKGMLMSVYSNNIAFALDTPVNFLDRFLLSFFLGNAVLADFYILKKFASLINYISEPINAVVLSRRKNLDKSYISYYSYVFLGTGIVYLISLIFFEDYIGWFSGYAGVVQYSLIYAFAFIYIITNVFSWIHLEVLYRHKLHYALKVILIANILFSLGLIALLPFLGIMASPIALLLQVAVILIYKYRLIE